MQNHKFSQISIVQFLADQNIFPASVKGMHYWYLSPLREEHHPSFLVNAKSNVWYDYGIGQGGGFIDLGCRLLHTDPGNLFRLVDRILPLSDFTISPASSAKTRIIRVSYLLNITLLSYLKCRRIQLEIARKYCKEILYERDSKRYIGIGLENESHGYEIRTSQFKGTIAPKAITMVHRGSATLCVFEGMIDFLSWFSCPEWKMKECDFMVLNSVAMLKANISKMEAYSFLELYLDNDSAGQNATKMIMDTFPGRCINRALQYLEWKDLNAYLTGMERR